MDALVQSSPTATVSPVLFEVRGPVKWFDSRKGFGFIAPVGGGPDVLVHISTLKHAGFDTLVENATVVCMARKGEKGNMAVRIVSVNGVAARKR